MKWFLKITFKDTRRTIRERVKLTEALLILCGLPLGEWRHIREFKIERLP